MKSLLEPKNIRRSMAVKGERNMFIKLWKTFSLLLILQNVVVVSLKTFFSSTASKPFTLLLCLSKYRFGVFLSRLTVQEHSTMFI